MSIGSLIFGAAGMYIYLRRKGVEPPPEVLKWERRLKAPLILTPELPPPAEKEIKREI